MWLKYSNAPILNGEYGDRRQKDAAGYVSEFEKPRGCWITDDSADCWRSWCLSERFNLDYLTHKHEVVLDESNILILRSLSELDSFHRQYSKHTRWGPPEAPQRWIGTYLDWPQVAARYDGLIITPYQGPRRLKFVWYNGWDCASGCIWNTSVIRQIRLIEIDHEVAQLAEAA